MSIGASRLVFIVGRGKLARFLFWFLAIGVGSAVAAPTLHWLETAPRPTVEVVGLPVEQLRELAQATSTNEAWAKLLAVYAEPTAVTHDASHAPAKLPPIVGSWAVVGDRLRFEALFPWARDVRYRAELNLPGAEPVIASFQLPARTDSPTATVVQVFPSGDVLPENQLKFYVQFSEPMSRGIYESVHVLDAKGRAVELPFLELEAELWDPTMTWLTLLIDPGRIKRGVKPLEDLGPVFREGESCALAIDVTCRDAQGRVLRESFVKKFRVGPADRTPPDPARWKISQPAVGTRAPLAVDFDEPMDHEVALRLIGVRIRGSAGKVVAGVAALENHERRWTFVPAQPWERGAFQLLIGTTIEDLAGNNIGKAFDVDAVGTVERSLRTERVNLDFEVK